MQNKIYAISIQENGYRFVKRTTGERIEIFSDIRQVWYLEMDGETVKLNSTLESQRFIHELRAQSL
jgi:protein involved in ribonucleotide reduction